MTATVDLTSHDGLRGVAAVWIMLFHYIIFSTFPLDFQGSSLMPLFFLLSGFSLAVSYGRKNDLVASQLWNFYRNRIARVYPVYLLCCLLALPYWFFGFGDAPVGIILILSIITSVIPVCTLFIFLLGACLDGPGWTVCTLFVMWLRFPYSMEVARKKSDEELVKNIVFYYWLQLFIVIIVFPVFIVFLGFWPAFAAATMNPISRYPLFLMGVYAGELCLRYPTLPLPHWPQVWRFFPCMQCFLRFVNPVSDQDDVKHWSDVATRQSVYIFLVTLLVSAADAIARYVGGAAAGIGGAVWFQAIVPYCQLEIIVALTRDGGTSLASRFLRHPDWLWLGKLSMCIYLIHYPIMRYTNWIEYGGGSLEWPEDCSDYKRNTTKHQNCENETDDFNDARQLPLWAIPVLAILSIALSAMIYYTVEVPARNALRVGGSAAMIPASPDVADEEDGVQIKIVSVRRSDAVT